ncbi:MAG: hypothetical protein LC785_18150 [Acidobacteria bacterium]|nr:hypothetical protein [Acidobacteriota bacterium]
MKRRLLYTSVGVLTLVFGVVLAKLIALTRSAPELEAAQVGAGFEVASFGDYKISGPYAHGNLSIFLIHGADNLRGFSPLTLEQAVGRGAVVVRETGEVNELAIENISAEEVFAQAGDIVKGGKQDRTLSVDLILPPHSGEMPLSVFCVEQGRWTPRDGEPAMAEAFSMREMIASKDLKMAVKGAASQAAVWAGVSRAQARLSESVGAEVRSAESASSLQLTLENEKVRESAEDYARALANIIGGRDDVIGYAFAINGELNSADVYASHALFRELWMKLLRASAVEAVAESAAGATGASTGAETVRAFLADAEAGAPSPERDVAGRIKILTRESERGVLIEARDLERGGAWLHRNYLSK